MHRRAVGTEVPSRGSFRRDDRLARRVFGLVMTSGSWRNESPIMGTPWVVTGWPSACSCTVAGPSRRSVRASLAHRGGGGGITVNVRWGTCGCNPRSDRTSSSDRRTTPPSTSSSRQRPFATSLRLPTVWCLKGVTAFGVVGHRPCAQPFATPERDEAGDLAAAPGKVAGFGL